MVDYQFLTGHKNCIGLQDYGHMNVSKFKSTITICFSIPFFRSFIRNDGFVYFSYRVTRFCGQKKQMDGNITQCFPQIPLKFFKKESDAPNCVDILFESYHYDSILKMQYRLWSKFVSLPQDEAICVGGTRCHYAKDASFQEYVPNFK